MKAILVASATPLTVSEQRHAVHELLALTLDCGFGLPRNECEVGKGKLGKPFLVRHPGVGVSWSHCAAGAVAMAAEVRVGVDVEQIRPGNRYAAARMFTGAELRQIGCAPDADREYFRLWTLKESYLKAIGSGLSYPLQTLEIRRTEDRWHADRAGSELRLWEGLPQLVIGIALILGLQQPREEIDITLIEYRRKL